MKIVVIGSSNTDMIVQVPRIPKPGETILGGTFHTAAGGKGSNQAVAAARAGGDVTFVARVGDDMFGEKAIAGFKSDNINVDFVTKDVSAPSGVAEIFVAEDGENSIAVASGANSNLSPEDVENAAEAIKAADIILMQLETPMPTILAAAKLARKFNKMVILNPAPAQALSNELLQNISLLTPNESEIELLTGIHITDEASMAQAAAELKSKGVEQVFITLGAAGVYVDSVEFVGKVAGFPVKAVDTTAAGDVFNGALSVALAKRQTIRDAVQFAQAAAALSVTKVGAQPSAPFLQEIKNFLS